MRQKTSPVRKDDTDFDEAIMAEKVDKKRRDNTVVRILMLLALIVFVGGWQLVHDLGIIDPTFISQPFDVITAFWTIITGPDIWVDIWSTFSAAILGLIIGSALGIFAGIALARMPRLERALQPYLTMINALPRPALAPIFILWFGLGTTPKVMVAVSIVFFILLLNTSAGIRAVNDDIKFLSRTLAMNSGQRFWLIELPHALPSIVAGLRLAAVYAVLGVVVSEIVAASHGLGQVLVMYTNQFAIAQSFAVLGLMALMAIVLDFGVSLLQRRLSWTPET